MERNRKRKKCALTAVNYKKRNFWGAHAFCNELATLFKNTI